MNNYQHIDQFAFTASSIAGLCDATCIRSSSERIYDVQIDSRLCTKGSLFFALKGERSDGFSYIKSVSEKGAAAVVVPKARAQEALQQCACAVLVCDDVLSSLHALSRSYVSLFPGLTTVGITGSCGKSTTKEAIACIAGELGSTAKTPGNLNSEYGLPLSTFALQKQSRYGIFEMGIDHVGEMDRMVSILKPRIALLTNIGISHLEKLGSQAIIAREKAKIFHPGLEEGFVSRSCKHLSQIERQVSRTLNRYDVAAVNAIDLGLDGWLVTYQQETFQIRAVGSHLLEDIVGAIAVGTYLGASPREIAKALEGFTPMQGRSSVHRSDITIIDDSYNASLDSTRSILSYISSLQWKGEKKVVLGPMKELGNQSRSAHRSIADLLASSSFSRAYLYGREMAEAATQLKRRGYASKVSFTEDFGELEAAVEHQSNRGDLILLKASRSVGMERLIPSLTETVRRRPLRYA
ncbi:MAG: UDP-N-acetylmuramoyl-tripeptide--D-alanyl-D-alanine ligase [Sphaerochaetaceae bacterium]